MLSLLRICNVRLIEQVELTFSQGLSVLSGETGAGKSILLEALGLALGERAESGMIRQGAPQAQVTAAFALPPAHGLWTLLKDQGLDTDPGDLLVLRRLINREGTLSRAFINEQVVSVTFLRQVATHLVDIHGQFDQLIGQVSHTALLDRYGHLQDRQTEVAAAYAQWQEQHQALAEMRAHHQRARDQEAFLRYSLLELQDLAPQADEENTLLAQRSRLSHQEKLRDALENAATCLSGPQGACTTLAAAHRFLERVVPICGPPGILIQETMGRLFADLDELERLLASLSRKDEEGPFSLERLDDRLFQLKAVARKHQVSVVELPALQDLFQRQLDLCTQSEENQQKWEEALRMSREDYLHKAATLHQHRLEVAQRLEARVAQELPALKLDKASFQVQAHALKEEAWGPQGTHTFAFQVSANPGEPAGPLHRVASGGELSRFLLALKVAIAGCSAVSTLIFDEIDSGTGGAVAEAIGLRLRDLSDHLQVLAITHAPQVAAQAHAHWKVSKDSPSQGPIVQVALLTPAQHLEEIARMLSGATITEAARAAALQLKQAG